MNTRFFRFSLLFVSLAFGLSRSSPTFAQGVNIGGGGGHMQINSFLKEIGDYLTKVTPSQDRPTGRRTKYFHIQPELPDSTAYLEVGLSDAENCRRFMALGRQGLHLLSFLLDSTEPYYHPGTPKKFYKIELDSVYTPRPGRENQIVFTNGTSRMEITPSQLRKMGNDAAVMCSNGQFQVLHDLVDENGQTLMAYNQLGAGVSVNLPEVTKSSLEVKCAEMAAKLSWKFEGDSCPAHLLRTIAAHEILSLGTRYYIEHNNQYQLSQILLLGLTGVRVGPHFYRKMVVGAGLHERNPRKPLTDEDFSERAGIIHKVLRVDRLPLYDLGQLDGYWTLNSSQNR
jgi:hypothetical protein